MARLRCPPTATRFTTLICRWGVAMAPGTERHGGVGGTTITAAAALDLQVLCGMVWPATGTVIHHGADPAGPFDEYGGSRWQR